jgi:hypothetical protein
LENHTNIPDLAPTNWLLQALRYDLGYHKYRDNCEVEPVVIQCPVFLTEDTKFYQQRRGNLTWPCDKYLVYSEDYMERRWTAV